MFFVRAHYAEFDKTMRHENSIGQDIHTKKKLRYFFAPLCIVSHRPQNRIRLPVCFGFWVNNLPGKKGSKLQLSKFTLRPEVAVVI